MVSDKSRVINQPANSGKTWTGEMDDKLMQLLNDGHPLEILAQVMERSPAGIIGRMEYLVQTRAKFEDMRRKLTPMFCVWTAVEYDPSLFYTDCEIQVRRPADKDLRKFCGGCGRRVHEHAAEPVQKATQIGAPTEV